MLTEFEIYLRTHGLPEEAIGRISGLAVSRTLRRNEFLFRTGEVCRYKVFILNGMLRTFSITADGNEHILQFSPEHSWTLDVESYDKQVPSKVNINAVEASEILLWHKADFDTLLAEVAELKIYADQLISRNIHYSRDRILTALGGTPEEKYEDFISKFPGLLSRLPLRMIASYLGISLKTLNRVRHAQLQRI
jgi:CRP/FNR family transcriptional regulator